MMKKSATYSDVGMSYGGAANDGSSGSSYQNGGGPDLQSAEFKTQKEGFFSKVQQENAGRRE
jgi:hypothetical protein